MFNLIDTHCHLDQNEDISRSIKEAKQAGVEAIIAVGVDYNSNLKNLEIAQNKPAIKVFAALGIHPTEIKTEEIEKSLKFIKDNIKNAIAIGEIGLDYWHKKIKKDSKAKETQRQIFIAQLKIAQEFNLPVIIHSRGAWKDCLDLILASKVKKAVFHWYSGPLDILKEAIQGGFLVSATPALAYSPQHQEAIKNTPLENILIETDSPVFYRNKNGGFRAAPKDVILTLGLLAQIKEKSKQEVKTITAKTAVKFFHLESNG